MKYLRDERNWFFEEKIAKQKVIENSVWPARILHQQQVRISTENPLGIRFIQKVEEASTRKSQLQRQLSTSVSSLKQSRAGSACSTPSHLSPPSK